VAAVAVEDVVICGGGLAGLLLALQLRREVPELSVTVLERSTRPLPDSVHKVGESSVEVGSQYMERLGLGPYLVEHHIIKFALRFFPGGGTAPLEDRTEIGPNGEPVVKSYQLDRGRFESDMRARIEAQGATLVEGVKVTDITLNPGDEPHQITVVDGDVERTIRARWVVDATGRAGLIRRQQKLKRGARHAASASWFRVKGKLDINSLVPASAEEWHARPYAADRWRSTNHLMGNGYWAWIIPLSTGNTSIGVVVHEETHSFDDVRTLERTKAFLTEHETVLAAGLEDFEVMDFGCIKQYSHNVARGWSADRWALTGEAGAFVDPLYSPGTDFIAYANAYTAELIKTDARGEPLAVCGEMRSAPSTQLLDDGSARRRLAQDGQTPGRGAHVRAEQRGGFPPTGERLRTLLERKARSFNLTYRALVGGAIDVFRESAPVYGHARAMAAKIYWDNFSYWSFPAQYFQQRIYELPPAEHDGFGIAGGRFVQLSAYLQSLFRAWAELLPMPCGAAIFQPMPAFPSLLVDTHLALEETMTADETMAYVKKRAREGEEITQEMVIRAVQEVGPELAGELLDRIGYAKWDLGSGIVAGRLSVEELKGLSRRHKMSATARDVERSLGPVKRHPEAAEARTLLLQRSAAA
ncbi:MAG: flavin-dependent dehydrogenase, partial [Myxococcota bacterium]